MWYNGRKGGTTVAKTIKFNLICDGYPVRTVEDLQNHFSVEDVLDYYQNRLLQRWLRVRGYTRELMDVSDITSTEPMEIVKQLIRIFDVAADEEEVEEGIYMLQFLEERDARLAQYEQRSYQAAFILQGYRGRYNQLNSTIRANPANPALIKACLKEIARDFDWIFQLDYRRFFYMALNDQSPLIIMCLLMDKTLRRYYLPDTGNRQSSSEQADMFSEICRLVRDPNLADGLGDSLRVYAGSTKEYWKDLEPKGKKYMILKMESRNFIRPAGADGQELGADDINYNFPILDGIDYKSNYPNDRLLYMEV